MEIVVGPTRFLTPRPGAQRAKRDYVSVAEAAYDLESDDAAWLEGLLRSTEPVLSRGLGIIGYRWRVERGGARLVIDSHLCLGCPPRLPEALTRAAEMMSERSLRCFQTAGPCHSHSEARGFKEDYAETPEIRDAVLPLTGARDMLNVRATTASNDSGVALGACVRDVTRLAPRTKAALSRVAAHIIAASRLRASGHRDAAASEAIFDACGKLLHAESEAALPTARALLGGAVERITASRGRLRTEEPERALELWRALVSGRWSVVDHVDTDGKRLILARRNQASVPEPVALTPNERLVAIRAASGHSSKLIAYESGLSASTVSALLHGALRKLRIRTRVELTALFFGPATGRSPGD